MKKLRSTRRRKGIKRSRRHFWRGIDLAVTYNGAHGIDGEKDRAIRKALGKYETGSGFLFSTCVRDHSATVPEDDFDNVLGVLKKIRGIRVKKLVQKWVLCR